MIITTLYYFCTFMCILSSLLVITVNNPIYSVLFLVLTFMNSAGLLFLLEVEFISLMFIIVYVGAIAILFVFVVMMLDVKITNFKKNIWKYIPVGFVLSFIFLIEIVLNILENFQLNPYDKSVISNYYLNCYKTLDSITDIELLGQILYTNYILEFLIAGLILLLAVICSVCLTNVVSTNVKKQIISKQTTRRYV